MIERIVIYGLAYNCPKRNRDIDCPLLEIENLSFEEKIDWLDGLNEGTLESIIEHHYICTKRQPNGLFKNKNQ